ncbi:transposase, IS4 family protein [Candidatus Thiomargarita nelsonii]|uniref:Transposase, IS4 family protein n=1 Tax=Candidatus Thiomargarita nelsonii TaxID=1003181 RepID=A0A176RW52_9GAMM|nr:transposase, IS4 family protein [Candidatus Thiomargarita nelsonii]
MFIDGTERPTQRASDYNLQKDYYSGKKKRHTLKNLTFSNSCHKILVLSNTQPGKNHDYTLFKELNPQIPSNVMNWVDLGFQGIETDFPSLEVIIPKKKPRGKELTSGGDCEFLIQYNILKYEKKS